MGAVLSLGSTVLPWVSNWYAGLWRDVNDLATSWRQPLCRLPTPLSAESRAGNTGDPSGERNHSIPRPPRDTRDEGTSVSASSASSRRT